MADIYVNGTDELKEVVIEELKDGKVISIYLGKMREDADGKENAGE